MWGVTFFHDLEVAVLKVRVYGRPNTFNQLLVILLAQHLKKSDDFKIQVRPLVMDNKEVTVFR